MKSKKHVKYFGLYFFLLFLVGNLTGCPENDDTDPQLACYPGSKSQDELNFEFFQKSPKVIGAKFPYRKDALGRIFLFGDLLVSEDQVDLQSNQKTTISITARKWPINEDGKVEINYFFAKNFSNESLVDEALDEWEKATKNKFRFIKINVSEEELRSTFGVYFTDDETGCWAGSVPQQDRSARVNLGLGCKTKGIAIHEIGHILGLNHEMIRYDRDNWIKVNWCNIKEDYRVEFLKTTQEGGSNSPYDFQSIMHYGIYEASVSMNKPTMSAKDPSKNALLPIDPPSEISPMDGLGLRCIYEDQGACQQLENM